MQNPGRRNLPATPAAGRLVLTLDVLAYREGRCGRPCSNRSRSCAIRTRKVIKGERRVRTRLGNFAPQTGHVSSFCGSVDPPIEPADVYCLESDSNAPPTLAQGGAQSGHLSNSPRDSRVTSGWRVIRQLGHPLPTSSNNRDALARPAGWGRFRLRWSSAAEPERSSWEGP